MADYALLLQPHANRVYSSEAPRLLAQELRVFAAALLEDRSAEVDVIELGGVPYLRLRVEALGGTELAWLSNLSALYALFRMRDGALEPVRLRPLDRYDDDLITIPKYQGKTNEQFTKLLLNVTLLASRFAREWLTRRFTVLDPLCGRGTTLNQALMYGFDAAGIDLDRRDFDAYEAFLKTWLKRKRLKHSADVGPLRRDRRVVGRRMEVTLAADRDSYKAGDTQSLTVLNAETTEARNFFRAGSMDLVVCDAPYGVQHGSRSAQEGLRRSPQQLLEEALPEWQALLRPGGALGVSFNTRVTDPDEVAVAVADAGLEVCQGEEFQGFSHRVDQAIVRDLIVARKPDA